MSSYESTSSHDSNTFNFNRLLDATMQVNGASNKEFRKNFGKPPPLKLPPMPSINEAKEVDGEGKTRLDFLVYSPPNSLEASTSSYRHNSGNDSIDGGNHAMSYNSYLNMPLNTPSLSRTANSLPSIGLDGLTAAQLAAIAPFGFPSSLPQLNFTANAFSQQVAQQAAQQIAQQAYQHAYHQTPPLTPDIPSPVPSTISNGDTVDNGIAPPGFSKFKGLPLTPTGPTILGPLSPIGVHPSIVGNQQPQQPDYSQMQLPASFTLDGLMSSLSIDPRWSAMNQMYGWDQDLIDLERRANERVDTEPIEPTYTWSGQLPPRNYKNPIYSNKVFLGGVPWDVTEVGLQQAFRPFGPVKVEWPGKETSRVQRNPPKGKGYCYLIFESEKSVKALLGNCTHDFSSGGDWYYKISSRRMRSKEVQVIPWVLSDSNFVKSTSQKLDPNRTVFVGGLHGMINAEALCSIMKDLFDNVIYAGIDTDKHKYPIGSGRVTFGNHRSYMKAIQSGFIEIRSSKFTKKVQIDPYLEDSMCSTCHVNPGPFFCRDPLCFRYFCHSCWGWHHSIETLRVHKPMTRHSKSPNSAYHEDEANYALWGDTHPPPQGNSTPTKHSQNNNMPQYHQQGIKY